MDGSAYRENEHRTLASQPAAAAHVGATVTAVPDAPAMREGERGAIGGAARRTRLERMLLAARQMQQH